MRRSVACCLHRCYLQQRSRCVLLGVNDQSGAIPEGQGVAQEDDQPRVPGEETHDQTLPDAPSLSPVQVPVVPSQHDKQLINCFILIIFSYRCIIPVHLLLLSPKGSNGSDGGEDFIGHGTSFSVGLQLHPR